MEIILLVIMVAPVPILIPFGIKVISKTSVMGANDNLSALAVCLSAARYFSDPKNKLTHSELWIVSFGCEEIGIRGSKRFVSKYLDRIKNAYSYQFRFSRRKRLSYACCYEGRDGCYKIISQKYVIFYRMQVKK